MIVLVVGLERAGFTVWEYAVRLGRECFAWPGWGFWSPPGGLEKNA